MVQNYNSRFRGTGRWYKNLVKAIFMRIFGRYITFTLPLSRKQVIEGNEVVPFFFYPQ